MPPPYPVKYVSNNPPYWTGTGSPLTHTDHDGTHNNFDYRLTTVEADIAAANFAGIDYFSVTGSNFYVHLTNHEILGPYPLPGVQWNFTNPPTGLWLPSHAYNPYDVFYYGSYLYSVNYAHTSALTFDPGANDGMGNNYYRQILGIPAYQSPLVQTQSGASWTPAITDANTYNRFTHSTTVTMTIPAYASVPFLVGTEIHGRQAAAGTVVIVGAGGVTVNLQDGSLDTTAGQGATFTVKNVAADSWDLFGRLTPHP